MHFRFKCVATRRGGSSSGGGAAPQRAVGCVHHLAALPLPASRTPSSACWWCYSAIRSNLGRPARAAHAGWQWHTRPEVGDSPGARTIHQTNLSHLKFTGFQTAWWPRPGAVQVLTGRPEDFPRGICCRHWRGSFANVGWSVPPAALERGNASGPRKPFRS